MKKFNLKIISAEKDFYEGPCESLVAPLMDGQIGILADHYNMMGAVVPGELHMKIDDYEKYLPDKSVMDPKTIKNSTEGIVDVVVSSGLLKVENGDVTMLVDSAELPHEIDENRALRAAEMAKEELRHNLSIAEHRNAEHALLRATARISSKRRHFG